jgi:hypothetical protein
MTIFAVLMPAPQPALAEKIKQSFPNDHYALSDTQWLISASQTAIELSAKLGIVDPKAPTSPITGLAVIFATSSYYGRAPQSVWDWIKTKLESPPNG